MPVQVELELQMTYSCGAKHQLQQFGLIGSLSSLAKLKKGFLLHDRPFDYE